MVNEIQCRWEIFWVWWHWRSENAGSFSFSLAYNAEKLQWNEKCKFMTNIRKPLEPVSEFKYIEMEINWIDFESSRLFLLHSNRIYFVYLRRHCIRSFFIRLFHFSFVCLFSLYTFVSLVPKILGRFFFRIKMTMKYKWDVAAIFFRNSSFFH